MKGSCHCGAVVITVPGCPDYLNQCNCSACSKLGALWGYYSAGEVQIAGETHVYNRADADPPMLDFHFCGHCGATTHWSPTQHLVTDRVAVNMRLFEPGELSGVEVRYGDRRNHPNAEPRRYYRTPTTFGETGIPA